MAFAEGLTDERAVIAWDSVRSVMVVFLMPKTSCLAVAKPIPPPAPGKRSY